MTAIGIAALALLLGWVFGGLMLRFGGLLLGLAGVLGLALSANVDGILIAGIGALLWLLGHGHYSLRHGVWKSRIAGSLWRMAGAAKSPIRPRPADRNSAPAAELVGSSSEISRRS